MMRGEKKENLVMFLWSGAAPIDLDWVLLEGIDKGYAKIEE